MKRCPNCDAIVEAAYCGRCGQRYTTEPYAMTSVLSAFASEVTDLESGFLATGYGLTTRPGHLIRRYWRRATASYVNPVKYFLFAVTALQLVLWQTGGASDFVEGFLRVERDLSVSRGAALQFFNDYFSALFAAALPVAALITQVGSPRTLAEEFIFHFYVAGHLSMLWSALFLIERLVPVPSWLAGAMTMGYFTWALATARRPDTGRSAWRAVGRAAASFVVIVVLYAALAGFLVGIASAALEG